MPRALRRPQPLLVLNLVTSHRLSPALASNVLVSYTRRQRRRGEILDHGEPDAAGAAATYFDRSDDDRLVAVALASAAALFLDTSHIGLIHFDNA